MVVKLRGELVAPPRIVAAGAGDVEELVCLNTRLFLEDAGTRDPRTDTSWPARYGREHFLGLLSRDDAVCFLAWLDAEEVGYLAGYLRKSTPLRPVRIAELQSMYVVRAERGRGTGRSLVEEFLAWARRRRAGLVSVTAYATNGGAIRFYERAGFDPRTISLELEL